MKKRAFQIGAFVLSPFEANFLLKDLRCTQMSKTTCSVSVKRNVNNGRQDMTQNFGTKMTTAAARTTRTKILRAHSCLQHVAAVGKLFQIHIEYLCSKYMVW